MPAQTSYSQNLRAALAGLLYEGDTARDVVSRKVETAAGIGFGLAVSRGTAEDQITLGGTSFLGISVRSLDVEGNTDGEVQYDEKSTAPVLRQGYIWAVCTNGCNPGDAAKYVQADGTLASGAANAGETAIAGGTWESVTAAGNVGLLRVGV